MEEFLYPLSQPWMLWSSEMDVDYYWPFGTNNAYIPNTALVDEAMLEKS